jgi:hypothetical protein
VQKQQQHHRIIASVHQPPPHPPPPPPPSQIVEHHDIVLDQADHVRVVERTRLAKARVNVTRPLSLAHELTACENIQVARSVPPESVAHYEPSYETTAEPLSRPIVPARVRVLSSARSQADQPFQETANRLPSPANDPVLFNAEDVRRVHSPVQVHPLNSTTIFSYESAGRLADQVSTFQHETLVQTTSVCELDKLDPSQPTRPVRLNLSAVRDEPNIFANPPEILQTPTVQFESLTSSTEPANNTRLQSSTVDQPLRLSKPISGQIEPSQLTLTQIKVDDHITLTEQVIERLESPVEFVYANVKEHRPVNIMPVGEIRLHTTEPLVTDAVVQQQASEISTTVVGPEMQRPADWSRHTVYSMAASVESSLNDGAVDLATQAHVFVTPDYDKHEVTVTNEIVSIGPAVREVCLLFLIKIVEAIIPSRSI